MYKILGLTDEVTTCECCGKQNLKHTVVLDNGENMVHFGSSCAAKKLGQKQGAIELEGKVRAYAAKLQGKGFDSEKIANAVAARYGWCKHL